MRGDVLLLGKRNCLVLHRDTGAWRLRVVEGVGERVSAGIIDAQRGEPECLLNVSEDRGEGGGCRIGVAGPGIR